ncbi:MAG TPA: site-specific integrase [Thermoanaerobaculia bacterium]|nr:site-specific integrase [Thermoanaerobaculia bacterium]
MGTNKNITRLPSGNWQARVRINGKRVKETFATLEQAVQFRDAVELDAKLRKHGLPGLIRARPALVAIIRDFLEAHELRVRAKTLADGTLLSYHQRTAGVVQWVTQELRLPGLCADEVDDGLVARYIGWRVGRKLGKKATRVPTKVMVRKDLGLLSRIYRWAGVERRWSIPRNLPRSHGGKRVLEPEQVFAFLDAMPVGSLERTVAEHAIATGMRPSDIFATREDQIDLEEGLLRFVAQKTGKVQVIPFGEDLVEHFRAWRRSRPPAVSGLLYHVQGRKVTASTLRKRFRRAATAAKIDPPLEYIGGARNALISWLLDAGESPYAVAAMVGHEDLRTTMGYQRRYLPMKALRRVAGRVAGMRTVKSPHAPV